MWKVRAQVAGDVLGEKGCDEVVGHGSGLWTLRVEAVVGEHGEVVEVVLDPSVDVIASGCVSRAAVVPAADRDRVVVRRWPRPWLWVWAS